MAKATKKRASRASQSITRHPLFPAIVALWFAALVGMGSFVLRTSLLESLVIAANIDSLVPAAAPPLGTTARLLLAAMFGLVGGTIGWILAWRLANPKEVPVPPVFNFADLEQGMAEMVVPVRAAPDKTAPLEIAPLMIEPIVEAPAPVLDPASFASVNLPVEDEVVAEDIAPLPAEEVVIEQDEIIPEEAVAPPAPTAAERIASADLAELSHVELIERLAIALRKREEWRDAQPADAPVAVTASPVIQFPDFADRNGSRSPRPIAPAQPAPIDTENALRNALAQLQRMSGGA